MARMRRPVEALALVLSVLVMTHSIWPVPRSDQRGEWDQGRPFPLDILFGLFLLIWEGVKWLRRVVSGQKRASKGEQIPR